MRRNRLGRVALLFLLGFFFITCGGRADAARSVGRAVIENGNVAKAREAARNDAMRSFVEKEVGIHVIGNTEIKNNLVISDYIMAHSDGYVQIKKIIDKGRQGNIYVVELELEADRSRIDTAPQDLKAAIDAMPDTASRYNIMVAVVGKDEKGNVYRGEELDALNNYLKDKMEAMRFRTTRSGAAHSYLLSHAQSSYETISLEMRRELKDIMKRDDSNAVLTGNFSTIDVKQEQGNWIATVRASFNLIGLDSDRVDTFIGHFTGVDKNRIAALEKARVSAAEAASAGIAEKAILTLQDEYRGGVKHIKTTIIFNNIYNQAVQRPQIMSILNNSSCRVLRSAVRDNQFIVFVETTAYNAPNDLVNAIMQNGSPVGLKQGKSLEDYGSTKLVFDF